MSAQVVLRQRRAGRVGTPMGGRQKARIRTVLVAIAATVAVAQPFGLSDAYGQRREVLLGTTTVRPDLDPSTDSGVLSLSPRINREHEASRLLLDARDDLSAGHIATAREQLQALVHRFSSTLAAEEARKILARMEPQAPDPQTAPASPTIARDEQGQRRSGRASSVSAGGRVDQTVELRRAELRRLELDQIFRASTGDRVFFANGSVELGARAREVVSAQARWLARHPGANITLEAHADDVGSPAHNVTLARQRAEVVRQQLIEEGVQTERVRIVVYGRDQQIAPCPQAACSAQNRRVVTSVTAVTPAVEPALRTGLANPRRD